MPPRRKHLIVRKNDNVVRRGGGNAPYLLEDYKLIFFTIPKNACTVFKQLFRRILGYPDWNVFNKTLPHDLTKSGLVQLSIYRRNLSKIHELLTSPEYTKVVFVRDPVERFLSAFLDKAFNNNSTFYANLCCQKRYRKEKQQTKQQCVEAGQTPQGFLQGIQTCRNRHWTPQYERLTQHYWNNIDSWFVGHVETAYHDTRRLLERLGIWEDFGESGWGLYGNESIFQSNLSPHSTGARQKRKDYITPELKPQLLQYYRNDYNHTLFGLERPDS